MQLFLANGRPESFVLELLVSYLQLSSQGKVRITVLSEVHVTIDPQATQKAVDRKTIDIEPPCLITSDGEAIKTYWRVAEQLIGLTVWSLVLLGETAERREQVCTLCTKYPLDGNNEKTLEVPSLPIQELQSFLQPKTFLVGNHITLADLHLLVAVHPQITSLSEQDKLKLNNLYRWYWHIQSLDGIGSFLAQTNRKKLRQINSSMVCEQPFLPAKDH